MQITIMCEWNCNTSPLFFEAHQVRQSTYAEKEEEHKLNTTVLQKPYCYTCSLHSI